MRVDPRSRSAWATARRLARYSALHDLCLLVDLHNFGKRQGLPLDQAPQAADALSDTDRGAGGFGSTGK